MIIFINSGGIGEIQKMKFDKNFLLGAATAGHQVEGMNIYSDFWAMEHMENTSFVEPSGNAVDHYHHYKEDINLLADSGLNAFRFSIEWARIEPEQGVFNKMEIEHYREVLIHCHKRKVTPVVTLHHFSSPKWLIEQGGWENEKTVKAFATYCSYVVEQLGDLMQYVCTINEANMGLQLASIVKDFKRQMKDAQVGVDFANLSSFKENREKELAETKKVFGTEQAETFLSVRTETGDEIIIRAHEAARDAMKKIYPHLKVGITLSLYDYQVEEGGEKIAAAALDEEFGHYLTFLGKDDFLGLQNYTRRIITAAGVQPAPEGSESTQMGYEYYPESIGHVIEKAYQAIKKPIFVTENGLATDDDQRRIEFIQRALKGVQHCVKKGIPVIGYLYWSLLDNFEWQRGFAYTFGLIAVDRQTQKRYPKESLKTLGWYAHK